MKGADGELRKKEDSHDVMGKGRLLDSISKELIRCLLALNAFATQHWSHPDRQIDVVERLRSVGSAPLSLFILVEMEMEMGWM
jgi:hypothetical protein